MDRLCLLRADPLNLINEKRVTFYRKEGLFGRNKKHDPIFWYIAILSYASSVPQKSVRDHLGPSIAALTQEPPTDPRSRCQRPAAQSWYVYPSCFRSAGVQILCGVILRCGD